MDEDTSETIDLDPPANPDQDVIPIPPEVDADIDTDDYRWMHQQCHTAAAVASIKPNATQLGVIGGYRRYREFLDTAFKTHTGMIPPRAFQQWLTQTSEKRPATGEEWADALLESLDEVLLGAVRTRGMLPGEAIDLFATFVENVCTVFKETHGLSDGWFDDAEQLQVQ